MQGWVLGWMGKRRNAFSNPALMVVPGLVFWRYCILGFFVEGCRQHAVVWTRWMLYSG